MWLMTQDGFFSVVEDWDDKDTLIVRARAREDLQAILDGGDYRVGIEDTPEADYPYRMRLSRDQFEQFVTGQVFSLDYPNFKDRVYEKDPERARLYTVLWSILGGITKP